MDSVEKGEAPQHSSTNGGAATTVEPLSKLMLATPVSPDDMDLENIVITGVLFLVAFFVLAPRSPRRLKRRSDSKERIQVLTGSTPSTIRQMKRNTSPTDPPINNTATLCTGMVLHLMEEEEETDEEKFVELWPAIRTCPYRCLVLPPECKRVPANQMLQQQRKMESSKKPEKKQEELDEDHPITRLRIYCENFLDLIRSILSYEYWNAAMTLLRWLTACIRLRRRHHDDSEEEEEEEEDDASRSSIATNREHSNSPLFRSPVTANDTANSVYIEEKKDMHDASHEHERSNASIYEVPLKDLGESALDEKDEPVPLPPSIPRLTSQKKGGVLKRKDALESYRGTLSSQGIMGQPTPLSPRPPPPPLTLSADAPELLPAHHSRNESEHSMSYFDAAHSRDVLKKMSVAVPVPDRNGYILGDEFLPNSRHTPLLVFVNSRSGPQQGQLLITQLRRLLNPIQVWDLADGGPEKILESFSTFTRLRILVCGGDGTVSWIISALEKMKLERWPPIAILPLGTGNDLARIHGWGGGYTNESLITILEQISEAYISLLDRWELTVENKKGKVKESKAFTNYVGVGVDAQAALQVHMLRESMPKFFFSRFVNKAWYALFGAEDAIKATYANLPNEITLIADGVEVPLPADSQGIILLNIDSYAGGIPMWSHATKRGEDLRVNGEIFYSNAREGDLSLRRSLSLDSVHAEARSSRMSSMDRVDSLDDLATLLSDEEKQTRLTACDMPSSCQDGMLDIVSIRGAFHLGQIRVGLSHAQRLCQCRLATVVIKRRTAIHIDGEPWRQTVATLHIRRKKEPAIMLHRSHDESGGVETEMAKLLDWAEERRIIDRNVHSTLMKEFSRRIESKTRQRRVRSQENLMLTLSRALQNNSFPSTGATTFPNSISF